MLSCRSFCIVTLLALSSIAHADDGPGDIEAPFQNHDWRLTPSLLIGLEHFHYAEGDQQPAVILDQHTAVLPTARLAVEATSPRSRFYARASFLFESGSMTYDGANQAGAPLSGPTAGYMTDVEGIIGGRGRIGHALWLGGYLGAGHHTWRRDLTPLGPPGYLEEYSWSYLPIGAVLDVAINRRLTITLDASIQLSLPSTANLHISGFPIDATTKADDSDLALQTDAGERLRVCGNYALTHEIHLLAVASWETFQIDDSPASPLTANGQPVTDSNGVPLSQAEPFSKTTRYSFDIGASYTF